MRVDKYTMAQSWMRQDDATPEEAKATWDTLETEFEDKRKAQLMASAETDAIIKTINDKFGPGTMFPASEAPIPEMTDTQRIMEWNERNRKAGGGRMLNAVQMGEDMGNRTGFATPKGTGIQLAEEQLQLLKDNLTKEEFKKLKFGQPLKGNVIDYGVRQRKDNKLYKKIVNILSPGSQASASKIINNEKLSNALVKSTNAGDHIQTIITKMNKLDKSLSRNQISSAINALVARGNISEEFGRVRGKDLTIGEQQAYNKIIEEAVDEGKLNRAQIARKAGVSDSVVEDWIKANKGDKFYEENFTYEKGRLKTGTLQKQKDLFNYIETVDNISAKEIKKLFKMGSGKETQKLMSDLLGAIYRMRGIRGTKEGSLVVPYDDEARMKEVVNKIRNAPDFEDIYQRRIGDLITEAYPKGPKRTQALKSLGEYWKFSRNLKAQIPELALALDHVVPFQFLEEVKQGKNPINLIRVKPIPAAVNRFKANFDSARIELNRGLKINPKDKNLLNKFKLLRELEGLTEIEFGGVSAKGNVYDFKAKPIGQSDLIADAIEGIKTYDKIGRFSKKVLADENLQKKLIEAGVETGKNMSAFRKITPLNVEQNQILEDILGPEWCGTKAAADGGRIGFSKGSGCPIDVKMKNFQEANDRVRLGKGTMDDAAKIRKTNMKGVKTAGSLKALLGIWGLGGEALIEGAFAANEMMKGKSGREAWSESYASYLDPTMYKGGIKLSGQDVAMRELDLNTGEQLALKLDNQSKQLMKLIEQKDFSEAEGYTGEEYKQGDSAVTANYDKRIAALKQEMESTKAQLAEHGGMEANTQSIQVKLDDYRDKQGTTAFTKPYRTNTLTYRAGTPDKVVGVDKFDNEIIKKGTDPKRIQRSRAGKNNFVNREIIGREVLDQNVIPNLLVADETKEKIDTATGGDWSKEDILRFQRLQSPETNKAFWKIQMGQDSPVKGNIYGASDTFFGETYDSSNYKPSNRFKNYKMGMFSNGGIASLRRKK